MKYTVLFTLALGLACTITACKKEKEPEVETPKMHVPDFEYAGKQYVWLPITFKSNFTENTQLTWNFGDGEEETIYGREIAHTYKEAGTYTVTMSIVDSFGGAVSKAITVTNGPERVGGKHKWNFFLKAGDPLAVLPVQNFSRELTLDIVNDTTIRIPDIPQMRIRGPYTVTKYEVNAEHLVYKSSDLRTELSYDFNNGFAGMKIVQVHKDTAWTLTGGASFFN
ncbi:MAG: PKD domain-containing protein [Taibaiella sp.]|nr:PKD domain-containing protein [Taibaiella sp.]